MQEEKTSEFGKGFTYCLFLFAKHWWRHMEDIKTYKTMYETPGEKGFYSERRAISMWFNGAADHLFELEVPEKYKGTEIGDLAERLQKRGLEYRLDFNQPKPTLEDFKNFFEEMEKLMMLIDKDLGVEPIEADYN